MNQIDANTYAIYFDDAAYAALNTFLSKTKPSSVFVLLDEHTYSFCYEHFSQMVSDEFNLIPIQIPAGEQHKTIDTCLKVWHILTEKQADRNSILINVGGGMLTDLGGFVAATYKRGIQFINVPTTLLSMVDASVGSKTGVDLGHLKNLIGLFVDPQMVLIDLAYLKTLAPRELKSGVAEIVKYGLTLEPKLLEAMYANTWDQSETLATIVHQSIQLKNEVVKQDLHETGLRKVLNYGHTIGHAIESFYLNAPHLPSLLHGEAIGIGMIVEGYFSHELFQFPAAELNRLKAFILKTYGKVALNPADFDAIISLCKHDKKNKAGEVKYVLLKGLGEFEVDLSVEKDLLYKGLTFYLA